jgi:ubiquinone biosynthesis protein UbiJ
MEGGPLSDVAELNRLTGMLQAGFEAGNRRLGAIELTQAAMLSEQRNLAADIEEIKSTLRGRGSDGSLETQIAVIRTDADAMVDRLARLEKLMYGAISAILLLAANTAVQLLVKQ